MDSSGFTNAMKTFWHAITSDDRHANFNSGYRTTASFPGVGRNPELNSVSSSRLDGAPYNDELGSSASRSSTALASSEGHDTYSPRSSNGPLSPASPYSPGSRSNAAKAKDGSAISGIPLQDFNADGSPPPPPPGHSWRRIDRWAEDNYPELWDQLCEGATVNDINELEHDMDCSLPMDVRESLRVHDGQERGGTPTGIIFGAMLLDCEEILDEWKQWQLVRAEYLQKQQQNGMQGGNPVPGPSSRPESPRQGPPPNGSTLNKAVLMSRQDSQPEGAVQKVYCHPGWIPLVRDWGGNNIGIDLAPGPAGKWGQVIIFGRDYDCKYVVARSWGAFLATVADDLESSNWYVDEDSGELKLRELKTTKVEPGYLDILRLRCDKKYGRKIPPHMRRRPGPPQMANASGNGPVGPRPGPGTTSPGSPMIGFSPTVRPEGREQLPARTLSPIHAPKAIKPISGALNDPGSASGSGANTPTILTPARTSLQSSRSTETPPPLIIDGATKKRDDLEDLSDLISTPTTSKPTNADGKRDSSGKDSSKGVNSLADGLEDVDLGKDK